MSYSKTSLGGDQIGGALSLSPRGKRIVYAFAGCRHHPFLDGCVDRTVNLDGGRGIAFFKSFGHRNILAGVIGMDWCATL